MKYNILCDPDRSSGPPDEDDNRSGPADDERAAPAEDANAELLLGDELTSLLLLLLLLLTLLLARLLECGALSSREAARLSGEVGDGREIERPLEPSDDEPSRSELALWMPTRSE